MIGKKEWSEIAKQIYNLETRVGAFYRDMASRVNDPELKKVFMQLSSDEKEHAEIITGLSEEVLRS